ncbi:NtEIG-E80 protein [Striga asiatica]|uniref:NtEIG-E80 protein n=1 Tax=Striga asiatica TaxID=4170 RepID=A0A5A7RF89_STRAF|nr:NtEIG-E80 protein [Striga asiatica]
MASSAKTPLILILACFLFLRGAMGELICESLPANLCSFAVASSGKRCALENRVREEGTVDYTCTTSEVVVVSMSGYVETDACVAACGVDRQVVGISSDAFLSDGFTARLCSPECYQSCPNIVDLYFNLAAGEGVYLPALCEKQKSNPRRAMSELFISSGGVFAAAPAGQPNYAVEDALAPAPAVH